MAQFIRYFTIVVVLILAGAQGVLAQRTCAEVLKKSESKISESPEPLFLSRRKELPIQAREQKYITHILRQVRLGKESTQILFPVEWVRAELAKDSAHLIQMMSDPGAQVAGLKILNNHFVQALAKESISYFEYLTLRFLGRTSPKTNTVPLQYDRGGEVGEKLPSIYMVSAVDPMMSLEKFVSNFKDRVFWPTEMDLTEVQLYDLWSQKVLPLGVTYEFGKLVDKLMMDAATFMRHDFQHAELAFGLTSRLTVSVLYQEADFKKLHASLEGFLQRQGIWIGTFERQFIKEFLFFLSHEQIDGIRNIDAYKLKKLNEFFMSKKQSKDFKHEILTRALLSWAELNDNH